MGKRGGILSILRRNCGQSSRDPLVIVRCRKLALKPVGCSEIETMRSLADVRIDVKFKGYC